MFGLPEGITACLFDLDGVLTDTADVHAAAWKEMFDDVLGRRADASAASRSCPFDRATTTALRRRPPPGRRRPVVPGVARHRRCPRASRDDPPAAETVHGLGNRKNDLVLAQHRTRRASTVFDGLGRLRAGRPGRRAAPRGGLVERQHPGGAGGRPGSRTLFDARGRRRGRRPSGTCPASPPRTRSWPRRRAARRRAGRGAVVFEDALAGRGSAGRAGGFGLRRRRRPRSARPSDRGGRRRRRGRPRDRRRRGRRPLASSARDHADRPRATAT